MLEAPELSNPRAERVSAVRALSSSSVRKRRGEMLVEGPQAVREALRFAPELGREFYFTPKAAERYPEIMGLAFELKRAVILIEMDRIDPLDEDGLPQFCALVQHILHRLMPV